MAVNSVNGKTGDVVLNAGNVSAVPLQSGSTYFPTSDGSSSVYSSLSSALSSLASSGGGTLYLPNGVFLLDSNTLDVPSNVCIQGALVSRGEIFDHGYRSRGTVILTPGNSHTSSSSPCIRLRQGASLKNLTILNSSIPASSYPTSVATGSTQSNTPDRVSSLTIAQTASAIASFSGTAIILHDDDPELENLLIIGFAQAVTCAPDGTFGRDRLLARVRLRRVYFDCTNGIALSRIDDTSSVEDCHGWIFFQGHLPYPKDDTNFRKRANTDILYRSGNAFQVSSKCDGLILNNCFSYGWQNGLLVDTSGDGVGSLTLVGTTFDNYYRDAGAQDPGDTYAPTAQYPYTDGVVQVYKTNGVKTVGSGQLGFASYGNGGGAQYVYWSFQHSGQNAYVNGDLTAGLCKEAWMECYSGSQGAVSLTGGGTPNKGIHFYSGIGRWRIHQYNVTHSNIGDIYTFDPVDKGKLQLGGAYIDSNSPIAGDSLGARFRQPITVQKEGTGCVALAPGDTTHQGYIQFQTPDANNTRSGYIGFSDGSNNLIVGETQGWRVQGPNFLVDPLSTFSAGIKVQGTMEVRSSQSRFFGSVVANPGPTAQPISPGDVLLAYNGNGGLVVRCMKSDGTIEHASLACSPGQG